MFGTSCQVISDQLHMSCDVEVGAIIVSQNMNRNCLLRNNPVFEFSNCDGYIDQSLTSAANNKISYYRNNGSGCFHYNGSTRHALENPEIVFMYITRMTLNISSGKRHPGICNSIILCDFHIWEASCNLNEAMLPSRQTVCHNTGIIISVEVNNLTRMITLNNTMYEINKELTYNCAVHNNTTTTKNSILADIITSQSSDHISRSPTTGYDHIPFNSTSISKSLGDEKVSRSSQQLPYTLRLTVGISASVSVLAVLLIILTVILFICTKRKAVGQSEQHDGSHSIQDQSELPGSANVYEQVHIHPFVEITPSAESEAISNAAWQPQADFDGIYSHIDTEEPKSETRAAKANTDDDPTYDTVGKEINKEKNKVSRDGAPVSSKNEDLIVHNDKASCLVETPNEPKLSKEALEVMYAVVDKKQKKDVDAPPVPPHTVEELYTAVAKNSKVKAIGDEEKPIQDQLPLPTFTIKEQYTAVQRDSKDKVENKEVAPLPPPYTVEELYTAVQKTIKGTSVEGEDEAPPIPPHTVEELYTAVMMKKPKGNTEDKEEAPPIPPYTVDNTSCSSGIND